MSAKDDYILVTDSRNMGDDAVIKESTTDINDKNEEAAELALKRRGIVIDNKGKELPAPIKSQDTFYQELKDIGGIEILSSEEGGKGDY
ncbi:MAG: hypothetical protein HY228_01360 [Candidatus Yonathbacteria bacterium]|nr:hypothetical protein [Candidatus Yonathbacteria bacterium]